MFRRMDTSLAIIVMVVVGTHDGCSRGTDNDAISPILLLDNQNPSPPVLVSPANGRGIGVPSIVTLRWKAHTSFGSYVVELSANDSTFRRIVFSAIVDTPFVQTVPLDPNRYYWHVKAIGTGRETPWSATWWFLRSSLP